MVKNLDSIIVIGISLLVIASTLIAGLTYEYKVKKARWKYQDKRNCDSRHMSLVTEINNLQEEIDDLVERLDALEGKPTVAGATPVEQMNDLIACSQQRPDAKKRNRGE